MVGIRSYGAYIPKYRLGKETAGWTYPGEKAVANFDEDSVTMAVAAGADCLRGHDRSQVDGVLFGTTTPPYLEKQGAAIIAAALDLRHDIYSADITGVLRAGTTALRMAIDAIDAGRARQVLVVASDCRMAAPRDPLEPSLGDGAAAFLVSADSTIAEIEACHSVTDSMLDVWRSQEDEFVRSWEDRFVIEEGYQRVIPEAVSALLAQQQLTPKDVSKAIYHSRDARRHGQLAAKMGFEDTQVQDPLFGRVGNTGTAFPLMLAVSALEEAGPGDRILVAGYGDGCDVLSIRASDGVTAARDGRLGVRGHLESKLPVKSYDEYARWRALLPTAAARRPAPPTPSVSALWRETDKNLRLHGGRCRSCGYVQYPPQRVCVNCQTTDSFEAVRLSDQGAEVFTYSMDYVAGSVDVPLVITVINFNGGGRMMCMMTDREIDDVKIGVPVEMTFRKLHTVGGIHNYYWKSMPVRA
jgi:3-hydroxy-3-methylglutaryl CoA synthase